ncbi:prepilin-type N-terminal cleavage/methylation domain-containing protein [Heliobacterium undosum]|uniref:Prepilin-type N-terminal cleavage/methylation domain-containing protein n=1 Tax=Heliomicrobium undosum TaxID=121734 RepID=A0A845L3J3_9FIRM|nr:type II secretion system protein [Heliomicrobium undosum]MZP31192.1 prepilin-type N-terminal cleavage/methylation domain-containing protein [Heliomicrobium undosum]
MGRRIKSDERGMTLVEMLTVVAILSISFTAIYAMIQMNTRVLERESKSFEARSGAYDQLNNLLRDAQKARKVDINSLSSPNRTQLVLHNELFTPNGIKTYLLTDADGDGRYVLSIDGTNVSDLQVNRLNGRPFFDMTGKNVLTVAMSYCDSSAHGEETVLETSIASRVYGPLARIDGLTLSSVLTNIRFNPSIFYYSATGQAGVRISLKADYDDNTYDVAAILNGQKKNLSDGDTIEMEALNRGENKLIVTIFPDSPDGVVEEEDKVNYEVLIYGE